MINPQTVNPLTLPSVPLENRSQLPSEPCIYFAIDSLEVVQYIGMTTDLKQRWNSHHRYEYVRLCRGTRIAYLQVDDIETLPEIEAALIRLFQPPINKLGSSWLTPELTKSGLKVRRIIKQEVDVPGLGAKIRTARELDVRSLSRLAKEVGISRNYWYQLEAESVLGGVAEDTLREIEKVLGIDFGVDFERIEKAL
jgi:DNA-binding XRE family transcriptional regulator